MGLSWPSNSPIYGHSGCFWFFTITKRDAGNILDDPALVAWLRPSLSPEVHGAHSAKGKCLIHNGPWVGRAEGMLPLLGEAQCWAQEQRPVGWHFRQWDGSGGVKNAARYRVPILSCSHPRQSQKGKHEDAVGGGWSGEVTDSCKAKFSEGSLGLTGTWWDHHSRSRARVRSWEFTFSEWLLYARLCARKFGCLLLFSQ